MNDRNNRIDVMRGIAITLVVLEHALGDSLLSVQNIILSFHMPLFFIISGFFAKKVYKTEMIEDIKKKSKNILIPQITLSVIALLYNIIVAYGILHAIELSDIKYASYLFGYWFLHVMWQVVALWELLFRFVAKKEQTIYMTLICSTVYFFLVPVGIQGPLFIAVTPVAFGFYALGYILNAKKMLSPQKGLIDAILFILLCTVGVINGRVLMYENQYGNKLLFLITSMCGFFLMNDISYKIKESKILAWIGRNSIIVYVVHFHIVQGTRGLLMRLAGSFTKSPIFGIIVFLISYIIVLCMTWFCDRYLGILFGRSRYIRNGRK